MYLDIRFKHILKRLAKEVLPVSREALANMLGVSEGTVKNLVRSGYTANAPFEIEFIKGKGYVLYIKSWSDFESYLTLFDRQAYGPLGEQLDQLMRILLEHTGYVTIAQLEAQFQVSRGTILKLLTQVEQVLSRYQLTLERKPKYGLRLIGSEEKIRWLMFQYATPMPATGTATLENQIASTHREHCLNQVGEALQRVDESFQTNLADDAQLVSSLGEWLSQLLTGSSNNFEAHLFRDVYTEYTHVWTLALHFLEQLGLSCNYPFQEQDSSYVTLHLCLHYERHKIHVLRSITHIVLCSEQPSVMTDWLVLKIGTIFPTAQVELAAGYAACVAHQASPQLFLSTDTPVAGRDSIGQVPLIHIPHYVSEAMGRQLRDTAFNRLTVSVPITLMDLFHETLFVRTQASDYLALLEERCVSMEQAGLATVGFWESVKERELKITTIYAGGIANPHPMRSHAVKSGILVVVVENKLRYQDKPVALVFIVNLTREAAHLHRTLSLFLLYLMEHSEVKDRLRTAQSFAQFKEILTKIV